MEGFSYSLTNSRNEIQSFLAGFSGDPSDMEEEEVEDDDE